MVVNKRILAIAHALTGQQYADAFTTVSLAGSVNSRVAIGGGIAPQTTARFSDANSSIFKSNHETITVANVSASKEARDKGTESRRSWLAKILISSVSVATITLVGSPSPSAANVDALPQELRQFTALAPLGAPTSTGDKVIGLSLSELSSRLSHDLVEGSTGKGGYFISGDISTQIFRDNCTFIDPTNSVSSLSRYKKALVILFDPDNSFVQLLGPLEVDEENREITARIRSGGVLKLPWNPRISSYNSIIKYKIDENGLVESQIQEWSIPASQALRETFTLGNRK